MSAPTFFQSGNSSRAPPPARYHENVTARLNLAALTAEELQALLGENAAQAKWPDLSRARLEQRPLPGPEVPRDFRAEPQEERVWGATPEQARQLGALDAELRATGAAPVGVYYLPAAASARHVRAYEWPPDTALSVRWSETPDSPRLRGPHLELLTWLRDRASGAAAVVTSSQPGVPAPAFHESVDVHLRPGQSAAELLAAHRQAVSRHGRGQKLAAGDGWAGAWSALHALNVSAWERRDLLLDVPEESPAGLHRPPPPT